MIEALSQSSDAFSAVKSTAKLLNVYEIGERLLEATQLQISQFREGMSVELQTMSEENYDLKKSLNDTRQELLQSPSASTARARP